jgi:hypothetical protein
MTKTPLPLSKIPQRPSLLVQLRLIKRSGAALDEEEAWTALIDAFRLHPTLDVYQAEIAPDKGAPYAK